MIGPGVRKAKKQHRDCHGCAAPKQNDLLAASQLAN